MRTPEMHKLAAIGELAGLRTSLAAARDGAGTTITVCGGPGCQASGCGAVIDALRAELSREDLADTVHVRVTGCHGFCEQGPIMVIEPGNIFYCRLQPSDVPEIVSSTLFDGEVIERLLYTDPVSGSTVRTEAEIPFYRLQDRTLLALTRQGDSSSIP